MLKRAIHNRWKGKFVECHQLKGLATEWVCYAVTAQWVLWGSVKAWPPSAIQLRQKLCVCLCYAGGDAELRGPRADTAKGHSALPSQKSNQNISTPTRSWQNKILASSDTDTTQIPHQGWQMCFTLCEDEQRERKREWRKQSHSNSDTAERDRQTESPAFKSPVESLCKWTLIGMRGWLWETDSQRRIKMNEPKKILSLSLSNWDNSTWVALGALKNYACIKVISLTSVYCMKVMTSTPHVCYYEVHFWNHTE